MAIERLSIEFALLLSVVHNQEINLHEILDIGRP